jgi:hypothetical protein
VRGRLRRRGRSGDAAAVLMTCASDSTCSRRPRCPSPTATGRRAIARRTCGCSGWPPRCCARSRRGCSTRTRGGSARSARSGAGAGRGGEEGGSAVSALHYVAPRTWCSCPRATGFGRARRGGSRLRFIAQSPRAGVSGATDGLRRRAQLAVASGQALELLDLTAAPAPD